MNDLIRLIRGWAAARNLIKGSTAINQYAKLMSEIGELASAISRRDKHGIMDGIGDAFVVLTIICAMLKLDMEECNSHVQFEHDLENETITAEFIALISTLGALGDAVLKSDFDVCRRSTITAIRTFKRIADIYGVTFQSCVEMAYEEIKDRKGIMYNGAFIKSTDARYDAIVNEIKQAS